MATVSSIVVRRRLASMRQVEDALARQTLYGGDVVTNLLEVAPPPSTDEAELTRALAEALDLPAAFLETLRAPDPAAVARVARPVAEQYGIVPVAIRDGAIVVALAEPLAEPMIEELSQKLGAPIVQQVATTVRLRQALERAYGVPMDRRTRRLVRLLDGESAATASMPPPRSAIPDVPDDTPAPAPPAAASAPSTGAPATLPSAPSAPSTGAPATLPSAPSAPTSAAATTTPTPSPTTTTATPTPATTIRSARPGADALRWFLASEARKARESAASRREASPRASLSALLGRRRRGPFSREEAEKLLADPPSADVVLATVLEFAQQYLAHCSLFLVHGDVAEGWDAVGKGASGDRVRKMGVPLDLPSMFASARDLRTVRIERRPTDGLDAVIAADLERGPGDVMVAPIVVGNRVVALLHGDDGGDPIDRDGIADVLAIVASAGASLARMILRKKKKVTLPVQPAPPRDRKLDPETLAERAQALASALAPRPPSVRPASLEPIVAPRSGGRRRQITVPGLGETPTPLVSPPQSNAATPVVPSALRDTQPDAPSGIALARVSQPIAALRDLEGEPPPSLSLPPQVPDAAETEPKTPVVPSRERAKLAAQPLAAPTPPPPNLAGRRTLGPLIPREEPESAEAPTPATPEASEPVAIEASEVSDAELEEVLALADRTGALPAPRESERVEVYSPRSPPRPVARASEHELPKVIVAIEPELVALVSSAIKGGEAAERAAAELRRRGVSALPAIMDRFPGPTRCDRTTPITQIPAASDAGPVLSLIVALGRLALRDVLARCGDPLPETRFWATWLLTEIVDPESAGPLVPRLVDDDLSVRRAAWVAARALLQAHPEAGEAMIDPLVAVLLDPGGGTSLRIRSANALGELRDRRGVEGLVLGLDAREPELAAACHESLVAITRCDPSRRGETWSSWLARNGNRSRIEWLIDALLDEELSFREAAAHELKEQTKVYFGYYANLPRVEREQAQKRYRTWWNDEGRRLFEGRV